MLRYLIISILLMSSMAVADPQSTAKLQESNAWDGTNAHLGSVINTGNTNTFQFNAGGTVDYIKNRWNNVIMANWQFGRNQGVVDQNQYIIQNEVNYGLDDRFSKFLFFISSLTSDEFSPYSYQFLAATGYGWYLWKKESFSLSFQLGPGYRRNKIDDTGVTNDQIVGSFKVKMKWLITKGMQLTQNIRYDIGPQYNYLRSTTAVTNKVTKHIAIQISFLLENYSNIPQGSLDTVNTNTTTNVSIVYNFNSNGF